MKPLNLRINMNAGIKKIYIVTDSKGVEIYRGSNSCRARAAAAVRLGCAKIDRRYYNEATDTYDRKGVIVKITETIYE